MAGLHSGTLFHLCYYYVIMHLQIAQFVSKWKKPDLVYDTRWSRSSNWDAV